MTVHCQQEAVRRDAVGNTPVQELPHLGRSFGLRTLFVKDESHNPHGTQKDRKSMCLIREALSQRVSTLCVLTAGNAGLSLAALARDAGLSVVAIVGRESGDAVPLLREVCEDVITIDVHARPWSSRDLRALAGERPGHPVIDATNRVYPYETVGVELAVDPPDHLVVPVGGGELFLGIADAFARAGVTTRLWGVVVDHAGTVADKLYAPWKPHGGRLARLTGAGCRHRLIHLTSDETILAAYREVTPHLLCEPSSAAAFAALAHVEAQPGDRVMVLNTGRFTHGHDAVFGRARHAPQTSH